MYWTLDRIKKYGLFFAIIILALIHSNPMRVLKAYALRITRPTTFQLPWTEEQVNDLNYMAEQLFKMQEGRFELDVNSSSKTGANNGEIWLIYTGSTVRLQFRGKNHVFTLSPDGY